MAGGADLLEHLEAALQFAAIEGAEDAFVFPVLIGDVRRIAGRERGVAAEEGERADHQPGQQSAPHHVFSAAAASTGAATAAAAVASSPPPFSTA